MKTNSPAPLAMPSAEGGDPAATSDRSGGGVSILGVALFALLAGLIGAAVPGWLGGGQPSRCAPDALGAWL